jgi:hypothetical protein
MEKARDIVPSAPVAVVVDESLMNMRPSLGGRGGFWFRHNLQNRSMTLAKNRLFASNSCV